MSVFKRGGVYWSYVWVDGVRHAKSTGTANRAFHPRLLELAAHYHFAPQPCRPGRGNEKGRVERSIRFIRESFFASLRSGDDAINNPFLNHHVSSNCRASAALRR